MYAIRSYYGEVIGFDHEKFADGLFDLTCQLRPFRGGVNPAEQIERIMPQGLDLDGISLARRAGRIVGVHPGIVRA